MKFVYFAMAIIAVTGCQHQTYTHAYTSQDPNSLRIGGAKPADVPPHIVKNGTSCEEHSTKWINGGNVGDGQPVWEAVTDIRTIPCPSVK